MIPAVLKGLIPWGFPMVLAIDIGGTKFSMAVFEGDAIVRRESRATDTAGGRHWMVSQIAEVAGEWRREFALERCGIGFGGPVNFAEQRVVLSTHVGGWRGFELDAEFVKRYVVDLAQGLKAAIMLLNPRRIVIGGGMSKAGDRLFVPLREELRRQITSWSAARIDVVPAALGDDSVLYGALMLARMHECK
jgi:predicted NBD/HSP70 family sugar kinase